MKAVKTITFKEDEKTIIKSYLEFTKPIHKLSPKEIDLLTEIVFKYHNEKDNFKRESDLWKKVFDYDSKMEYKESLDIQDPSMQNLLSSLRRKKVLDGNKVKESYIPKLDNKEFFLVYRWIKS